MTHTGWRLTLRTPPTLVVDARALQPAALAALPRADVERLALPHGRESLPLGEWFTLQRIESADVPTLELEGDCSRFDRIGWGLAHGRLVVHGSVGDHAGGGMSGGVLRVDGDAGDLVGCAMCGGTIDVGGSIGDFGASALPGEMEGMCGGVLVVHGNAGARLADRMRRGTVVVHGDAGDFVASRIVAGTVALGARCGRNPAWGMRRGSLVFADAAPAPPPTFVPVHCDVAAFWQLLARDLARYGGAFTTLPRRRVQRHAGDLAVGGHGEWLCATG